MVNHLLVNKSLICCIFFFIIVTLQSSGHQSWKLSQWSLSLRQLVWKFQFLFWQLECSSSFLHHLWWSTKLISLLWNAWEEKSLPSGLRSQLKNYKHTWGLWSEWALSNSLAYTITGNVMKFIITHQLHQGSLEIASSSCTGFFTLLTTAHLLLHVLLSITNLGRYNPSSTVSQNSFSLFILPTEIWVWIKWWYHSRGAPH